MGLFDKLVSKLTGNPPPVPPTSVGGGWYITATITGPDGPAVEVSDAEVAERVREFEFVLTTDPPALKTSDQWWNEDVHKRRRREGSEKAYAWLQPFVALEVAKLERLQEAQEWGPHGAQGLTKALRVLIRERRKAKEPYQELLRALYGTCIAADLSSSLEFEGAGPPQMLRFVDINELQALQLDYATIG
jgi:hypothetical protein